MTSPQPDQSDDQPDYTAAETAVIAALMAYFASTAAVSATLLPARLVTRLTDLGLEPRVVRAAGRLAMAPPLTGRGRYGSPVRDVTRATTTTVRDVKADEPLMRARYVLAAAKRLSKALLLDVKNAVSSDETAAKDSYLAKAVRIEKTYLDAHRGAGQNRLRAARAFDQVAAAAGPDGKLRWVAHAGACPICAGLDGTLFTVDAPPDGLIPGAVHPHCGCGSVPAYDFTEPAETVSAS